MVFAGFQGGNALISTFGKTYGELERQVPWRQDFRRLTGIESYSSATEVSLSAYKGKDELRRGADMLEPIEREMAAGNWQAAVELSQAAIADHPTCAKAHAYHAWNLIQLDRESEAVAPLKTAVELEPRFWQASQQLAQLLDRLGRYAEALEHAREALRERPSDDGIIGLVRGLERQVPEEITDSWQISSKPMFYTVEFTQNGDPIPSTQTNRTEEKPPSNRASRPAFMPKTDPAH